MNCPQVHTANLTFARSLERCSTRVDDGRWVPSRPLAPAFFGDRWRCAWMVFTGRADALVWPNQ